MRPTLDDRDADQIVVLGRGWIPERGAHADLMAAGGRYGDLVERDAQPVPAGSIDLEMLAHGSR